MNKKRNIKELIGADTFEVQMALQFLKGLMEIPKIRQLIEFLIDSTINTKVLNILSYSIKFNDNGVLITLFMLKNQEKINLQQIKKQFKNTLECQIGVERFTPNSVEEETFLKQIGCIRNGSCEYLLIGIKKNINITNQLVRRCMSKINPQYCKPIQCTQNTQFIFGPLSNQNQSPYQKKNSKYNNQKSKQRTPEIQVRQRRGQIKKINQSDLLCYQELITSDKEKFLKQNKELTEEMKLEYQIDLKIIKINALMEVDFKTDRGAKIQLVFLNTQSLNGLAWGSWLILSNPNETKAAQQSFLSNFIPDFEKGQQILINGPRKINVLFLRKPNSLKEAFSNLKQQIQIFILIKNAFIHRLHQIIQCAKKSQWNVRLVVLSNPDIAHNMLNILRRSFNYYVIDRQQRIYFQEKGNKILFDAFQRKLNSVELTGEDLNITRETHKYNPKTKMMTYLFNQKEFLLTNTGDKITFKIQNNVYQLPQKQAQLVRNANTQINISVSLYHFDLVNNFQINKFTGFKRSIQTEKTGYLGPQFKLGTLDCMELTFPKKNQNKLQAVLNKLYSVFAYKLNRFKINIPANCRQANHAFLKTILRNIGDRKYHLNDDSITLIGFQQIGKTIVNNIIQHLIKMQFEYYLPPEWTPQTQQIVLVNVQASTPQFASVQKEFQIEKIIQLYRIQNKILYRKYQLQIQLITKQNSNQVPLQMRLFHGTRETSPQIIYNDRQQSFNINYSGQKNYAGRGIYFALKAAYSSNYSYLVQQDRDPKESLHSMLLCTVIVGDSNKIEAGVDKKDIFDTDFKPQLNVRYQSNTSFLNGSDIYIVYKNQRAYPLYLITFKKINQILKKNNQTSISHGNNVNTRKIQTIASQYLSNNKIPASSLNTSLNLTPMAQKSSRSLTMNLNSTKINPNHIQTGVVPSKSKKSLYQFSPLSPIPSINPLKKDMLYPSSARQHSNSFSNSTDSQNQNQIYPNFNKRKNIGIQTNSSQEQLNFQLPGTSQQKKNTQNINQ